MNSLHSFASLSSTLEQILEGTIRQDIVADAAAAPDLRQALLRLRESMRSHGWSVGARSFDSARAVEKLDRKTRQIGFHVLHDWDGIADRVNEDTIPVDVLNYLADRRGEEAADPARLAMLLDYHFMHLLGLLSVRVWDEGDADDNLDRVDALLQLLQGPHGSGQLFAADAETLLLLATSHYEMYERGYAVLLEQVRTLNERHRTRVALGHAVSMGCHLRFGFEATYGRDTINMRDDNVADYPWLLFALATLMEQYVQRRQAGSARRQTGSAGLQRRGTQSAKSRLSRPWPTGCPAMRGRLSANLRRRWRRSSRSALPSATRFTRTRRSCSLSSSAIAPRRHAYSPLNFFFNFSHNVVKGTVIDALLNQQPWRVTFNDLLTSGSPDADTDAEKQLLARHADGLRPRQSPNHPRPSDAGHRLRPRRRPPGLQRRDAETARRLSPEYDFAPWNDWLLRCCWSSRCPHPRSPHGR